MVGINKARIKSIDGIMMYFVFGVFVLFCLISEAIEIIFRKRIILIKKSIANGWKCRWETSPPQSLKGKAALHGELEVTPEILF